MTRMSFEEYLAVDAINWSTLKHMEKSPLHYRYACDHPSADTTGRLKGRGTHTAVLEIERFMIDYACFKGKIRRGKKWDAFKAVHPEDNILKLDEYEHCLSAAKAVRNHHLVKPILERSEREVTVEWVDEDTGLKCKARLDLLTDDGIFDLKGVKSTDARMLASEVARMRYHAQLAWYQEGVKRARGRTLNTGLICVEHGPEHDVCLNDAGGEEAIYQGWELCRLLLNRVAECKSSKRWPGRHEEPLALSLPSWVWPDDEQVMSANEVNEDGEVIHG